MEYGDNSDSGAHRCNGFSAPRSTTKDRRLTKAQSNALRADRAEHVEFRSNSNPLYHSNSNIEQIQHALRDSSISRRTDARRPSSSHGPAGIISSSTAKTNDSFFAMLQDYQPAILGVIGTDQRSPGPAEFMQGRVVHATPIVSKEPERSTANQTESNNLIVKRPRDPKVKNKLHRFLVQSKHKTSDHLPGHPVKSCSITDDIATEYYSSPTHRTFMSLADMEEQQRQRIFAHYDCQSLAANFGYLRKLRALATAKAASNASEHSVTKDSLPENGYRNPALEYNNCNELLDPCPHFCNETSGEHDSKRSNFLPRVPQRPSISYTASILESPPSETLWRLGACPFQNDACPIESVDHGAYYYRRHFYSQKHENWFGIDEQLGPLAISIKKEKSPDSATEQQHPTQPVHHQFRMIIRTSELLTLRGLVMEDSILHSRGSGKSVSAKELLEYVSPEIQINCLRLGVNTPNCEQQLLKLDEQSLTSKYKVGILYCRSGQSSEEDMYNNENAGPAFIEFLETIGKRVRLKGFQHYKAGLDNKTDSTGTHSLYAIYKDFEVMFHVCTMLPFTPNNRQQLLRKRHIGNDIVTIVFQEPGALPFTPTNIRSQFQHVFLIVRAINPCTDHTTYRVAISRSKEVPVFGPPLPAGALFSRSKAFAEFILAKTINAENAAHRSEKFANLATRTRREYLKDLCINYCTNLYIDPGNKFSIFPSKKKDKPKVRFSGDVSQRGAICWQIILQDHCSSIAVECFLGISAETLVIVEETSKQIIFIAPTRSILGWSTSDNSLRIFYHNGECITINMRYFGEVDEQLEVIERLRAVTLGNGVMELSIRRNMMGQLGFHVQPDGIVTQVDAIGQAWAAGLRRGYRLVEICKIVVATLSYGELIDLLKTSAQLTFVVIKCSPDSSARRGCLHKHCKSNLLSIESDHEAYRYSNGFPETDSLNARVYESVQELQHPVLSYKNSYEPSSLPHKSTSRSAYPTGSRSLTSNEQSDDYKRGLHTPNSCSPSHSCNNNKWYEILEDADQKQITLSLHRQYPANSFDHPKLEETASLPTHSKAQKSLFTRQTLLSSGDFPMEKPPSDSLKLLKHQSAKYELIDLKSVSVSPSESYTTDISPQNYIEPVATAVKEKPTLKGTISTPAYKSSMSNVQKIDLRGPVFPCPSTVKTAKLLPSITNFNSTSSIQRNMGSYSRSSTLRRDLLEIISPAHSDSATAKRNSAVERLTKPQVLDNVSAFVTSDPKQPGMRQTFEDAANEGVQMPFASNRRDDSCKPFGQPILRASGCSSRLKESKELSRHNVRKDMSVTPPLLPDTKELDWTTLVDTATKAIVLQLRDDNSCKPLSLCNSVNDIKNDSG